MHASHLALALVSIDRHRCTPSSPLPSVPHPARITQGAPLPVPQQRLAAEAAEAIDAVLVALPVGTGAREALLRELLATPTMGLTWVQVVGGGVGGGHHLRRAHLWVCACTCARVCTCACMRAGVCACARACPGQQMGRARLSSGTWWVGGWLGVARHSEAGAEGGAGRENPLSLPLAARARAARRPAALPHRPNTQHT